MSADGRDDDEEFVAEYENATAADIIEEAEPSATADGREDAETDEEGAVAGSFAPDIEVSPQSPTPENTLFVALGICLTILALADTVVGLSLVLVTAVVAGVGFTTAVCYGVLVRTTPET